ILVTDDEPDMVTWLTTFLEDNGYNTITANDGIECFEKAKSEHPDLITLDVAMDRQSGMKTLKQLQEFEGTSNIPIIIITGMSTDLKGFIRRTKSVEFPQGFIEKPVDRDELLRTVRKLLT
ncbi:MAG: response regulator, partial [candidate division Zixibacteria bacterium]|nr:response regulator [candidate division Zixibacteria bacterium]